MFAAIAVFLLVRRFAYGLGAVTNINNGYTWGIWVVWDVVIATGFACGGFAMAFLVYILNKGEFHPLVRPALTASVFGYSLGAASVLIDLGRYWNFWHTLSPAYFNPNSVMFEVAACISLYIIVLWIEFFPTFLEWLGRHGLQKAFNRILFFFIGLGVLLPSMHQSSLGSLLVVMGYQVHPLWQTQLLPVLFVLTAFCMGFAVVILEATLAAVGFGRDIFDDLDLLSKIGKIISGDPLHLSGLAFRRPDLARRASESFQLRHPERHVLDRDRAVRLPGNLTLDEHAAQAAVEAVPRSSQHAGRSRALSHRRLPGRLRVRLDVALLPVRAGNPGHARRHLDRGAGLRLLRQDLPHSARPAGWPRPLTAAGI